MNEPRRLREEGGSALELALLEAGRSVGASTRTRTKALAALGLAAGPLAAAVAPTQAVGALAGGAAAAPTPVAAPTAMGALAAKIQLTTTLGKVVAGLTLAGVTAAVPLGTMAWRHYRPTATTSLSTPARVEPRAETAKTPEQVAGTSEGLGRELVALDRARLRLAKGDTTGALGALDEYGSRFPSGRLALEAEVLRIDALAKGGRTDAAKVRARAFLRDNPVSVLAPRVRGYLGD
jgi:hypothetical protein